MKWPRTNLRWLSLNQSSVAVERSELDRKGESFTRPLFWTEVMSSCKYSANSFGHKGLAYNLKFRATRFLSRTQNRGVSHSFTTAVPR